MFLKVTQFNSDMKRSVKLGFSFGLTSGVITTLGLITGLESSTNSKLAVIGGIITIAIADACSDALGVHVSEESENKHSARQIWFSTISTFLSKFVVALTFIVPMLLFNLQKAVILSAAWGLLILGALSYHIAKSGNEKPIKVISEHIGIALIVIIATHYLGHFIYLMFGGI